MDDLNLYDDLDEFQEQQEKKSKELQDVEDKYAKALETIQGLKEDNKGLQKKIQRIELSFQSLLDTARTEIKRKDKEIDRLRKEKDDICFRRKFPNRPQETPDSAAPFQKHDKYTLATNKPDALQLKELEQDLLKVHKSYTSGCLARERSSDRFGESHKRHRSRDDRDSYYQKRQRSDQKHQMPIDSHRDNKSEYRKVDRERDYPYKNERPQKSDYSNHERNRNRYRIEYHTERHKTNRESSKSPVHGEYRKSRSEQYHNTKYSPSRRTTHADKYYSKSPKSSERKERSYRIQPEREENGEFTKNISYSKSPERKSSKTLNTVKEQHSSHVVNQRHEEQSHFNVCKDVGPAQHESDFGRKDDKSKLTSSQKTLHTSEKITNPVSSKNSTCAQVVAVKENLIEIKVTESIPNIITNQQFNDESAVKGSNENILNTKVTKELQGSQITKNRKASIEDFFYEYHGEETSTQSQSFEVEALLYENLDGQPCKKDLKQTEAPQELATRSQQVESIVNNVDYTIVSKTNYIQNVYEILDDELPQSSNKQELNNVDMNSLNTTKCSDICQQPPSNKDVVCEIEDNGLPGGAFSCQAPSTNDDLQKSTKQTGDAVNCEIPVTEVNMFLNPSKLCTPRKVALFDSLFGPSPNSASSADSNKNLLTNIMGIFTNNNGIDNDSTTTPPGDYSDCATLSNEDVDKTQTNFDMAAFENCFAENTKVTDKTLTSTLSEDSSVGCLMVVTPSREDADKNNTILTNILNTSPTYTSPGDSSNDCLIVVTPSRETIDGPQQSYDKTELDNCFVNNADILLDPVEQDKLKTNLSKTLSEDLSSECLMNPTQSKKVDDVALLIRNNIIASTECYTSENCGRKQALSNGDTIDLTEEYFGEEVERSQAPVLVNATNVITSKDSKDFEVDEQFTSLNNDVECYTSAKKYTEIPILNSGTQQREASEVTEEDNFNGKSDHSSKKNIETQKNHDNILTVLKKSDEGGNEMKCHATWSNPTRLLKQSLETITWDLTSPTKGTITKENKEEIIDDTSIIKPIETESSSTNTETKKYPNNIAADNKIHTDKSISAFQIVPDILNETFLESENNEYALSRSGLGRKTLHTNESISVDNEVISKPSVGITDLNQFSSNEVLEVREVSVVLRDSDTLQDTVSKETHEKSEKSLSNILNLDLTTSHTNEIVSLEDTFATEDLIPKTALLADRKIKTQNVFLETVSRDLTSATKEIISKKSHIALLPSETNYETNGDASAGKFNASALSSPDSISTTVEGIIEDKYLTVVPTDQLSTALTADVDTFKMQTTLSVEHKESLVTELIALDNSKGSPSTDQKSIDPKSFFTENVKPQTQVIKDIETCPTDSSQQSKSLYLEPGDAHKQQFAIQTVTLDQYLPTEELGAKPANMCGDLANNNTNGIETIADEEVSTIITVSNSTNDVELEVLTPHENKSQSSSKEHISSQTVISRSTLELKDSGTILKTPNLEQSLSSFTNTAGAGLTKHMISITSEEIIAKTLSLSDTPPTGSKGNIQFVEARKLTDANDLKNKEDVAVQSDAILEDSNNAEKCLKLRDINKKCCETSVNIPGLSLITSEIVENQTSLPTVLVKPSLLTTASSLGLTEESVPENKKENIEKSNDSKENAENKDLCIKTDQTANITAPKDSQQDCNNLRETTVNIPGLDLLFSSKNLEINLDASAKSPSHKTTMLSDNPKCIKDCVETERVPISNADVVEPNHSLSGSKINEFMISNKSKQSTDDTEIPPSQNANAEVFQDVDTVSIPGLDLLYPDIQQEFTTLNETGVNSTITKEKVLHVDARPTSSKPIPPEVHTDISNPNINNTNDSVCAETKESHKLPPSFDNDDVNEDNIVQENDVNCFKENAVDPIKFDAVTGEKDISVEKNVDKECRHSNREPFTLTEKFNVIKNNENNTKESETTQTKNAFEENVTLKSQLKASKEKTENINISDDRPQRAKQEIKPELKENAVVGIEVIDDLELRCSKDYKRNLQTAEEESDIHIKGLSRNNVFLPVDSPFVVDEDPDANTFNGGNVLNMLAQKCVNKHKVTEEINNNPETNESKKDTKNCRYLENKCKQLDVGELGQNSGSQIKMTGEEVPAEDILEKCIKSPPLFNKPAEKMASPNLKSVSRKAFVSQRELLDGMNVYSQQAVSKISASGKDMSEKSSSSNFDAIVNFERNLSLVDKSPEPFGKDIETIFIPADKKKESMTNCDAEQFSVKDKSDAKDKVKSIAGELGKLREQYPKHESVMKFITNAKHEPATETFGNETKNANTADNLSRNQNLPILCHKVSRILYNSSKIHLETTNNIPDLSCEEQAIRSMIFKNSIQTPQQNTEAIIITPPSVQTITAKELQNTKMINSPTCNHISPNLNYYRDQNQDLTVTNLDIAEIPNICLNPLCTTTKTPSRNISDTISSSLNTLKTSTVSDSYGLPNNLPSISTKCPTPPNFSGIFSKITLIDSASEDAGKYKKKSAKLKSYIIPAASVLCNVDNLQNATKASKKLHWEMLDNKNEMTEIEDDSDVNTTDEERPLDKKECVDDKMTHNEVTKLPTSDSNLLAPYKVLKSIKETAIESEGNKFSEMSANLAPNLPTVLKLKKSFTRRNSIDTVPPLTDDTLEQFKQLTITKMSTNESMLLPYKVIKNQPQSSRMSNILKSNLTPVKVKCPGSLMNSELLQAAMIKSTKSVSINMSASVISKPVLNLAANCKKSKKINAKVQQLVPIQKKKRGRAPKQIIEEQNIEDRAVSEGTECMSEKIHGVITTTNQSKEKLSDTKQKEPATNHKISEENVTQSASTRQKENYTIKKGPQCTGLQEVCQTEKDLAHKLVSIESNLKPTSDNKNGTSMNDVSACEESPVKSDVHKTSIIYDKLHSSDEQNSSVAENSEPECNKYLKEDGFNSTSKETLEPAYTQKSKENYKNDVEPPPNTKSTFKPADKSINYKIPKQMKQGEGTSSSDNKLISVEDISIKQCDINVNLSTLQMPKTVSTSTAKEFNKMSCGVETCINSEECEKMKKKAIEVQEQRHRNRETSEGTFKGEKDKSPEGCQRRQNKKENKIYNNEDTDHCQISNSRSKESFADIAKEVSTLASKKIAQTDKIIAMHLKNDISHVSDQGRNKFGNLKPRRKSMCVERTTENNDNLFDEDNTCRKVRPLRKSIYIERNFDEKNELVIPQTADRNINADSEESNQHTGRRKSVNTQRRILDTSSEGDGNSNSQVQTKCQKELKTKMDIIASDHKTNESITKSKTAPGESIKSIRSSSKTTKNEHPSENETENKRLPKTATGNSKKAVNRISTDGTGDNKIEIYNQYVQARMEYLRLQQKLLLDICDENDAKIELNKIGALQTDDQHFNETNRAGKNSNERNKNIKSVPPRQRRKTIHSLDSQKSNINENKRVDVDKKGTKSSKTLVDYSPGIEQKEPSSDINQEQMRKVVKKPCKDVAAAGKKEKPSKPIAMRRKSMYTEINSFDSTADHSLHHLNFQKSKDLQIDSDANILNLGRYQDGNSRKSTRNRRKSMYIERMPLISSDDNDTAPETVANTINKVYNNEACQQSHNPVETKELLNIEAKESLKLSKMKETNVDPRKRENNIDTEKIIETYGSTNLNDKEIQEENPSSIQGMGINPIKSLRMLKKLKSSDNGAPRSVEGECKKVLKKEKYANEDIRNSILQVGAEEDKLQLNKAINDSISITPFSKHQQIENQEKHLDKSDDIASDSDTSIIAQNIKNNKIGLKSFNLQRRILDSSSSDAEGGEKIANPEKTVIHNENKQPATILAVKEKRKRRIVKVLSTSLTDDQIAKKIKCTPDQFEVTTPASSPILSHPIFNTQVADKSQSHLNLTPLSNDDRFQEIDSTLRDMFHSPQHETERSNFQAAQDSGANITIDETVFTNRENDESTLNISGLYDSKSLNSSASQDQSATKHLSLGTSNYRFEKVSENVVNLFISRKRKRTNNKRTNNINES